MIEVGNKLKVLSFDCGHKALTRLNSMGIHRDSIIEIKDIQPIHGPYVIKVGKSEYSIGRGLFNKIIYEKINGNIEE